jgi:hypothetical protein
MKLFKCQRCGQQLYFDNTRCEACGAVLGYLPERMILSVLHEAGDERWQPAVAPEFEVRFCANAAEGACNWLLPEDSVTSYCHACRLNRTIPDLSDDQHALLWQRLEDAKHWMIYGIMRLGLPLIDKNQDARRGLAFDFLSDDGMDFRDGPAVMTGHAEGLITINLAEADDAVRERARQQMDEPYRTLLGHFRHEVGHYYWERLVRDRDALDPFRAVFGDECRDYGQSLREHHEKGPPADWQKAYVSAYASAHPWEDFAESWAHYLHIVDTLETAFAFRLSVDPRAAQDPSLSTDIDFDPYGETDFDRLIGAWLPVTFAVNSLNQSMGQPRLYPFLLAPKVVDKLRYIHNLIKSATAGKGGAPMKH